MDEAFNILTSILIGAAMVTVGWIIIRWLGNKCESFGDWFFEALWSKLAQLCRAIARWINRGKQSDSKSMNYRILIPSLVGAMIVGAFLFATFGERYRVFAAGSGVVMKVDRWTGKSWVRSGYNDNSIWKPVREDLEPHSKFLQR